MLRSTSRTCSPRCVAVSGKYSPWASARMSCRAIKAYSGRPDAQDDKCSLSLYDDTFGCDICMTKGRHSTRNSINYSSVAIQ
eukprot:scaffold155737_cov17-Prasinocladus_malaysianus.AAC.1